ncbi:MAG: sigma 54-interacting transcriptional regulator, partial [Actinobacteria bacterium]|nr:sigma 54-interacting transcriptional regulator [Actinomycetota bacterium]
NASPIIVDGKMQGAVVVFRDISDIIRLTEELNNSNNIIERLHNELREYTGTRYTFDDLVGMSPGLREAVRVAKKAARGNSTVLIQGESGTGKEIIAQAIHRHSARRAGPFIKVNCAAIVETLLESELFGHEKGAFTGALKTKLGRFELAHGGTIFLDEIGDMNFSLQAKLLRVLQEREFERVGGTRTVKVDVRVLAASNRDLKEMVSRGEFREDLYYRLDVIRILMPSLRERKEDIPALTESIIRKFNRNLGKRIAGVTPEVVALLGAHNWPGNVRELENVLERAMNVAEGPYISAEDVQPYLDAELATPKRGDLDIQPLEETEKQEIVRALKNFGTTLEGKKRAARALGVSLATLYNKLKRYRLKANSNL